MMEMTINDVKKIKISFFGGIEEMFDGKRELDVEIPANIMKIKQFLRHMYNVILKDHRRREELLEDEDNVKPGILVLHNNRDINLFEPEDTDSEDEPIRFGRDGTKVNAGYERLRIRDGDEITFLSIVHGG
uniref:Ubiquitin-related modifier 1 n=1 Tax=Panagrellus redivivus TaxID=6233 RepID=A0A7E4W9X1_PANRE